MSLDRTPSPQPGGGWTTPGLNTPRRKGSPFKGRRSPSPAVAYAQPDRDPRNVNWASAQAKSAEVSGYGFPSVNQGFFQRNFTSFSSQLPFHRRGGRDFAEKPRPGRRKKAGSTLETFRNIAAVLSRAAWRLRFRLGVVLAIVMVVVLFYTTPAHRAYRRSSWLGGGNKFVIILAANQGGGVMEWKGPREWAIERDSVKNKKRYTSRWGYDLEIVDMAIKRRYAHEWRESWEKVDTIRRCLKDYPNAEWFWWLDLNTFIMEPSYSLQSHIFKNLDKHTYRDINEWNPLGISHPPNASYLDPITTSATGDSQTSSINMLVPQDCSGFNLGSFFIRRSAWTDRLLDIWWDPVHYEQRHMQWEHKEQDAFEYLYENQPWIRPHTAFLPQRRANSFPPGACGSDNATIHYQRNDRDFMVNMAGCEWGRDCWGEMYNYREMSNYLNRNPWQRIRDGFRDAGKSIGAIFRPSDGKSEAKKGGAYVE
ncbi:MAG: alpha-1,6-mannosyltransferase [Chrysothrix sp. TS-e1954]|nr:MAG: alpha-1,6-mannosyltransferase [Chrysothrix sp. TS-e1954]